MIGGRGKGEVGSWSSAQLHLGYVCIQNGGAQPDGSPELFSL